MKDEEPSFNETTQAGKAERERRLAKAMRANLAKRKGQARSRAEPREEAASEASDES